MKSGDLDEDGFSILSDSGDMIAGVLIVGRKRVEVAPINTYSGFDPLQITATPEMQEFAEAEARWLGLLDE